MLELAARLREMSRGELAVALRSREFDVAGIRDLFDVAEALLATDSLDEAIGRLDRPHLATLAVAASIAAADGSFETDELAREFVRLGADPAVVERLGEFVSDLELSLLLVARDGHHHAPAPLAARLVPRLGADLPELDELVAAGPRMLDPVAPVDRRLLDRLGGENAYKTLTATGELMAALGVQPARELAKGGLSLPDAKRLAEATGVDLEHLPRLFQRAVEADLIVRDGAYWLESERGGEWMLAYAQGRWRVLAEHWLTRIPQTLRELVARRSETLSAAAFRDDVRWLYPAAGKWLDEGLERLADEAAALGLAVGNEPTAAARLVVTGELDAAAEYIATWFPPVVERVYLQHDLTIVAPGPLPPEVDHRLRGIADLELRDVASTYRVTPESVNRALASGESVDAILAFFGTISLTGVPQPVEYLIRESGRRFGGVRVSPAPESEAPAKTVVRSDDAQLIGMLEVDQAISSIGLRRIDDQRLATRFAPDVVFWALSDARYPVAAEDEHGQVMRLQRFRFAAVPAPVVKPDPIEELLDRVLEPTDGPATEQAWLARQLEAAARAKETLTVTVHMPGGQTADYLLAPASVANGRLRARDRRADIERTLPLSAIAAVAPAPVE